MGPLARGDIEEALNATSWRWEAAGDDRYHLSPPADVLAARLAVEPIAGGLRLALPPSALRVAGARAAYAVQVFALEANARLRLVRLGVTMEAATVLRVEREVVLPASARRARWLGEATLALSVAYAETTRALRALGTAAVAEAYLAGRAPEP